MKRMVIVFISVFFLLAADKDKEEPKKEIRWMKFEEACSVQVKTKKTILLNFYTPLCGWCRRMNSITYGDTAILRLIDDGFLPVIIDTRSKDTLIYKGKRYTQQEFAALFGVRGTPTTGFIDTTGNLVVKVPGYVPPESFAYLLKYVKGGWFRDMTYDEFYKSEKELEKQRR